VILNIFGTTQPTAYLMQINTNSNYIAAYSANGGTILPSTTGIMPLNAWSHCALTFNNGNVVLYLNGFALGSGTVTVPYEGPMIRVGAYYNNTNGFMGAVDDLRVYGQALTAAQVLALYVKQGTPVPTDGPRLAWQFESSNVESIQGLVPSAQVSPGPAQLQGLAALATNAPVIDTALFLPRFAGSYIDLGTSSPVNVDVSTSNLFVEAWVYNVYNTTSPIISAGTGTANNWSLSITGNGVVKLYANCFPGAPISGSFDTALPRGWYHIAFSWALGPTSNTLTGFINGNRIYQDATFTRGIRYTPGIQTIIGDPASGVNVYVRDIRVVSGGIVPTNSFTPVPMQLEQFSYALPSYVTGAGSVVFTLLSQFVTYPPGKFNKCLRLNNGANELNSRIEYSSLASTLNNFSIAAWVYPYSVNTARTNTFFEMKPLAVTGTQFQVSAATTGKSTVAVTTNGGSLTELNSVANLTLGKWTHHCLTFSNVGATIVGNVFASYYINGTLQASSNATTDASSLLSNLVMGSTTTASADTGLDDVRIYDRTLTSADVSSVYLSFGDPAGPKTYASGTSSNVTTDGDGFTTHTFTSPGTFTCTRPGVADVLVVAGGGGGAAQGGVAGGRGGGGGAGGVIYSPNFNIRAGVYTITVGNGGSGTNTSGSNGFPSQFMELFAIGGGGGGANGVNGRFGGSGGGAGRASYSAIGGVYGQGNSSSGTGNNGAGGGGGAKGAGTSGLEGYGGKGGEGLVFSGNIYGGGGAGAGSALIVFAGGSGGGGSSLATTGTPGTANTGGGGGGAGAGGTDPTATGGNGGSGIVIIKMFNQVSTAGYETVYTGETTIGNFQGYSQTANVQVFAGSTSGSAPYVWVKPSRGIFARIECIGGGGSGTSAAINGVYLVYIFMQTNGNLANGNTLTNAQMLDLGITYSGTITGHTITVIANPLYVIITTTGTNLFLVNLEPKPVGTVLNTIQGSSGTITGQYARGSGGGGGGYAFATLPLADLPATANVSVGGQGTASVFGPLVSPYLPLGNVTGPGGGGAYNNGAGSGGASPIASTVGIFVGGPGSALVATSIALNSYAGYGGGGGGNGLVPGTSSAFAGKGGDGSPQARGTYAQNGEYPGGGGGGNISAQALAAGAASTAGAGAGAPGQVRIIVY
jgi:hypothetical protein